MRSRIASATPPLPVPLAASLAATALLWLGCAAAAHAAAEATVDPHLNVVIAAISAFDDRAWQNPGLQASIRQAGEDLAAYFREGYPQAHVKLLSPPADALFTQGTGVSAGWATSREQLRHELQGALPEYGSGSLTLLFVISHGVEWRGPNPNKPSDLVIVASDTPADEPATNGIKVAEDLYTWLRWNLAPGSVVITFLDTCFSGASYSEALKKAAEEDEYAGLNFMLVSSARASQPTYRAVFTRALLDAWQQGDLQEPCTDFDSGAIRNRMETLLLEEKLLDAPFEDLEGFPDVVLPFRGRLCLNDFGANESLLLFYNAAEEDRGYRVSTGEGEIKSRILHRNGVDFLRLPKGLYEVEELGHPNDRIVEVDLRENPYSKVILGEPTRVASLADAYAKFADAAYRAGAGERATAQLALASSVYRGDPTPATGLAVENVGIHLAFNGRYEAAARQFEMAVAAAPDGEAAERFAMYAGYARAAAGQPKKAQQHRDDPTLVAECVDCIALEESDRGWFAKIFGWVHTSSEERVYRVANAERLTLSALDDVLAEVPEEELLPLAATAVPELAGGSVGAVPWGAALAAPRRELLGVPPRE